MIEKTQPSIQAPTKAANPANISFIVFTFLMSIMAFITAYLMINGRYLTPGFKETADGTTYAGMQIWDTNQLFIILTVLVAVVVMACQLWPKFFGKTLSLGKAFLLLLALLILGVIFFPKPFEFQLRKHHSAGETTTVHLYGEQSVKMFNTFTKETVEGYYVPDSSNVRNFNCVTEKGWEFGKLKVDTSFYPILDKQNQLKLLQQRCTELTEK